MKIRSLVIHTVLLYYIYYLDVCLKIKEGKFTIITSNNSVPILINDNSCILTQLENKYLNHMIKKKTIIAEVIVDSLLEKAKSI